MNEVNTLHGQMKMRRMRVWRRIFIALFVLILIGVGALLVLRYVTYDYANIVKVHESESSANGNYELYAGGVLEYSKDGVAMLEKSGKEIWNQPCQMGNPFVDICNDSVAVADKGGTSILVFQKDGLKGEIQTTRPIENVTVSAQGIVAAILKDEDVPQVMCYDAKGAVLVEHKVSVEKMGYPIDVGISRDGKTLIVSYLNTKDNQIKGEVVYYYFGEGGTSKENNIVLQQEVDNTIIPNTTFPLIFCL